MFCADCLSEYLKPMPISCAEMLKLLRKLVSYKIVNILFIQPHSYRIKYNKYVN
jgi:hypothetical protein